MMMQRKAFEMKSEEDKSEQAQAGINEELAIERYGEKIWGWETGAIVYAIGDKDKGNLVHLQNYPELMEAILELCKAQFGA